MLDQEGGAGEAALGEAVVGRDQEVGAALSESDDSLQLAGAGVEVLGQSGADNGLADHDLIRDSELQVMHVGGASYLGSHGESAGWLECGGEGKLLVAVQAQRAVHVGVRDQVLSNDLSVNRLAMTDLGSHSGAIGQLLQLQVNTGLAVAVKLEGQVERLGLIATLGECHGGLPRRDTVKLGLVLEGEVSSLPVVLNFTIVGVNPMEERSGRLDHRCMRIPILVQ